MTSKHKQSNTPLQRKVFVGLSGGVDSSVSAPLLQQQGFDVTGVFIKVWQPDFVECSAGDDRRDAMRVAAHLRIPFLTLDFAEEYKREVADYMIAEYRVGRTPNPDVMCNKYVKFGAFLKKALKMGADYVATGHYAQVGERNDAHQLLRSKDENKDQTYFLWTLGQDQLRHALFPVGGYTKPEVRELARKFGLATAEKRESQGVCFIGKFDMQEFLEHYIPREKGAVLDQRGRAVGEHDGAAFYTIGERRGFRVTSRTAHSTPLYVVEKNLMANTITVADQQTALTPDGGVRTREARLKDVNWIAGTAPADGRYHARIRHRQPLQSCMLRNFPTGEAAVTFEDPQWAIAPGQSLVLYDGQVCLGGGIII